MKILVKYCAALAVGCLLTAGAAAEETGVISGVREVPVAPGYAATSVNTAVFRGSSLVSDSDHQFIVFYDPEGRVVVGRRALGSDNTPGSDKVLASDKWELNTTQ